MRKFFTISAIIFFCFTVIMIYADESKTSLPEGTHHLNPKDFQIPEFQMTSVMAMMSFFNGGVSFDLAYHDDILPTFEGLGDMHCSQDSEHDDEICMGRIIDPSRPIIALTFDDGPSKNTLLILETLERYNSLATFFVIGNRIESRVDIVAQTFAAGHEILGHSWTHRRFVALSEDEIKNEILKTNAAIEDITGLTPSMMRTPFGFVDGRVQNIAAELEMVMINWSVDTLDWKSRDAEDIYRVIMEEVHDRAIILCHDIHLSTAVAMERVIPSLISQGYQLVTVSELMYYSRKTLEPGQVYRSGR